MFEGMLTVVTILTRRQNQKEARLALIPLSHGDGTGITPNPNFPHASDEKWRGAMVEVARIGNGEHFHAEEAEELQPKLKQIANIQPTIFTF